MTTQKKSSTGRVNARADCRRSRDRAAAAQPRAPRFDRAREHDPARSPQSGERPHSQRIIATLRAAADCCQPDCAGIVESKARGSATTRSWNFGSRTSAEPSIGWPPSS